MALVVAAEVFPWAVLGIPAGAVAARLGLRRTLVACNLLAGVLIALWGAPTVLVIDAASFLAAALLLLTFVPSVERPPDAPEFAGLLPGARFLARDPFLRPLTAAQVLSQAAFHGLVISLPVLAFVEYGESPKVGSPARG